MFFIDSRSLRRAITAVAAVAMLAFVIVPGSLLAQDTATTTKKKDRPKEVARPLVVLNVASINRVLENANFLFKQIDRPELMDLVGAGLANIRDFKGMDRDKSGGVMIFLAEGLLPTPVPIAFVPVKDIAELTQTMATTPLKLQPGPEGEDRYELVPKNGPKQYVRLMHGYALITQTPENLDREFVNPADFTETLSSRYDVALTANLKTTPEGVKTLLLNVLRTSTQAGMQQRDQEPEGAYRIRKAQAEGNLHFFENILKDGEEATIGLKIERENRKGIVEFLIRAKEGSSFAKELMGQPKPSYFAAAIDPQVPLSVSVSGALDDFTKKQYREFISIGQLEVNRGFAKLPATAPKAEVPQLESIKALFESLSATVDNGHLDGFLQFHGEPEKSFVVLGGVRLLEGQKFGEGLKDVFGRLRSETTPFSIEMSAAAHGDLIFHRITPNKVRPQDEHTFGTKPAIYVGTDNNALWFVFGGEDALPKLRATIDRVEASKAHAPKLTDIVPAQLVMNMSQWVKLNARSEKPGPFNALALDAFNEAGNDVLRLDLRPIENGFRMRIQLENGFIRLLGLGIAKQVDGREKL